MLKVTNSIFIILIIILLTLGCSGTGFNPLSPIDNPDEISTDILTDNPDPVREPVSERVLWGLWNITFDPGTMEVGIALVREAQAHFSVTNMILPPACNDCFDVAVNAFDPVTHILDADITLRNPAPIGGYDVRGILHTNDYGHLLTNPDDWTEYWDMPGGGEINPFIGFAKNQPLRLFAGNAEHTENFQVLIPTPPAYSAITFAVDASFPSNCTEPYSIDDFNQDENLYEFTGASVDVFVAINDWQGNVDSVIIIAPDITGLPQTEMSHFAGNLWEATLVNAGVLTDSQYEIEIKATSSGSDAALHDFFTVSVTNTADPVITGIDPDNSDRETSLCYVNITGANFEGPVEIELQSGTASPIATENAYVLTPEKIICDIDIPADADLGLYDVVLMDGCSKQAVGEDLFEVTNPDPLFFSIEPESGHAGETLYEVAISGKFFAGPASVEFSHTTGGSFAAGNVVVIDPMNLTCDVIIPIDAALGSYDVTVTNFDSEYCMIENSFEVICPVTSVTGIEPGNAEWVDELTGVIISGTNFYGTTANVRIMKTGVDDIIPTNVVVLSSTEIQCDIKIPLMIDTGLYDVEVTNDCGETGCGLGLFEVEPTPLEGWARTWGSSEDEKGYGVAVDEFGSSYVTGDFKQTVDFDPGPDEVLLTSNGAEDAYLCKYDMDGYPEWAVSWGSTGCDSARAVYISDLGNIYVTGIFRETPDFDPGPGVDEHSSCGADDSFLSVFDTDGQFQWAVTWGGSLPDYAYSIGLDGFGNIYLTGIFMGTTDLDPDPIDVDNHSSNGGFDCCTVKLDGTGEFIWGRSWGGADNDYVKYGAVDYNGNIYITGSFRGTVDFNPGVGLPDWHDAGDNDDVFLIKFDTNGNFQWAHDWGLDSELDTGYGVTVNDDGSYIYVTGLFSGSDVDFDPDPVGVDSHSSEGECDAFLMKLDSTGDLQWSNTWGGYLNERCFNVAVNDSGDVFVTGSFLSEWVDFNPAFFEVDFHWNNGSSGSDFYLSKFDQTGDFVWAQTWGGEGNDSPYSVATNSQGDTWLTGTFELVMDFDPDELEVMEFTSNGGVDNFLIKCLPNGYWE